MNKLMRSFALVLLFLSLTTTDLRAITSTQNTQSTKETVAYLTAIAYLIGYGNWLRKEKLKEVKEMLNQEKKAYGLKIKDEERDPSWLYRNAGICCVALATAHFFSLKTFFVSKDGVDSFTAYVNAFYGLACETFVLGLAFMI